MLETRAVDRQLCWRPFKAHLIVQATQSQQSAFEVFQPRFNPLFRPSRYIIVCLLCLQFEKLHLQQIQTRTFFDIDKEMVIVLLDAMVTNVNDA